MLKNKDKIRTALKFVKYLDSLPASSAGKSEKVRKIHPLQSNPSKELKLLEKTILNSVCQLSHIITIANIGDRII